MITIKNRKLFLYNCYHLNLAFSSIPEEQYQFVIEKCYWPFLNFCEKYNIKSGFEITAYTLIEIEKYDKTFIEKFKELQDKGLVELIGAGYTQTIFPLIPAEVNLKNLEIGNCYYKKILGVIPEIVYVNEQCYSAGLVSVFNKAGYKTMIMEINNSMSNVDYNKEVWYQPQVVKGSNNSKINVVWNNSILFQKFQRLAFGEIDYDKYLNYLNCHKSQFKERSLLFYGNDLEIFDYRPGNIDYIYNPNVNEIDRIDNCFKNISKDNTLEFILPSQLCEKYKSEKKEEIILESAERPLPTKKQMKYNPTRWAVSGRSDSFLNGKCFELYKIIEDIKNNISEEELNYFYEKLNFCWSSDFRTHTTDSKYYMAIMSLGILENELKKYLNKKNNKPESDTECRINKKNNSVVVKNEKIELHLLLNRGLAIEKLIFNELSSKPVLGTIDHGFYDEMRFSPDFYSGHCILYNQCGGKETDLVKVEELIINEEDNKISGKLKIGNIVLWKTYIIFERKVKIEYHFNFPKVNNNAFRVGIMTFNPDCFDENSLFYECLNGGFDKEKFLLKNKSFNHSTPIDMKISSNQCLGATSEELIIGDKHIQVINKYNKSEYYSVQMIEYEKLKKSFFLRSINSVSEFDETSLYTMRGSKKFIYEITYSKK